MITILAAGRGADELPGVAAGRPSLEVMAAEQKEEVLDKLARNRRVDAVLLMPGSGAPALAAAIREEDPAGPPVYAWGNALGIEGVHRLMARTAEEAVDEIVRALAG